MAEAFTGASGKYVPLSETLRGFKEIIEGKHDDKNEQAFYMKGGIDGSEVIMSKKIHFQIVTPEKVVYKDDVDSIALPTQIGEITVLPNHAPLISSLEVRRGDYQKRRRGIQHRRFRRFSPNPAEK